MRRRARASSGWSFPATTRSAVDDRATAWIPSQPALDVLAVTESDAFAGTIRALVATARGHVEVVNRAGLSERAGLTAGAGVVTVFDRGAPTADDGAGSVLYVAPPPGNAICPSARMLDDASVIDWDATHPVLAGLAWLRGRGGGARGAARAAPLGRAGDDGGLAARGVSVPGRRRGAWPAPRVSRRGAAGGAGDLGRDAARAPRPRHAALAGGARGG